MKKLVLLLILITFLLPVSVFAKGPTELEVQETAGAVLASFGIVFLTAMFGETPEGVTADIDMASETSQIEFKNFDAAAHLKQLSEMQGGGSMEDMPEFYFSSMTGTISIGESGSMVVDVTLKGGNVKTLKMKMNDDGFEYLTANGKDYSYLEMTAFE